MNKIVSNRESLSGIYLAMVAVALLFILSSCEDHSIKEQFMSVNGPVDSDSMGVTLSHEHVLVDWIGADSTGYHRWDREDVVNRVLPYFLRAKDLGVQTIIEFTPAYLGRDPYVLRELSVQSGIQVVTNTGYYGAVDNRFMPGSAYELSADEIADLWIEEFDSGIDDSGIRPGFIKISVAERAPLSELHRKIVNAAVKTHLETGMVIASHTIGDIPALDQIELLEGAGVSADAWIWTHAQSGSMEANMDAASKGAWIALDNVRFAPDAEEGEAGSISWYADRINRLKDGGVLDRVLISHDAGWYDPDEDNGGDFRGYTDIFEYLVPELRERGFSEEEITRLLVDNPASAFRIRSAD